MSVKRWCQERGVTPTTYYRWERELLAVESKQRTVSQSSSTVNFAELPMPQQQLRNEAERSATLRVGEVSVAIYQGISPEVLKTLIEALKSC